MRRAARLLAIGGILAVGSVPARSVRAAGDLTGRFAVTGHNLLGDFTGTFAFSQAGGALTLDYDLRIPSSSAEVLRGTFTGGTVDSSTGAFVFLLPDTTVPFPVPFRCTGNRLGGMLSPDGTTISGGWVQGYITFHGCVDTGGPFTGVRIAVCGDRVVYGDEECDDGNTTDGDCCSSTCRRDGTGASCDDGDPCTTADACDAAGTCVGPARRVCAPCETCLPPTGCVPGPEPACTALGGRASLALDVRRMAFAFSMHARGLEFRDPTKGTDYELCVFTRAGGAWTPLLAARVPAGGRCGRKPCWAAAGPGTRYRNPARTPDGLAVIRLRRSGPGAGASATGGGPNLKVAGPLPAASDTVRVQLRGADGTGAACYTTEFTSVAPHRPDRLRVRR